MRQSLLQLFMFCFKASSPSGFIIGIAERERKCYKWWGTLGCVELTAHLCIWGTLDDVFTLVAVELEVNKTLISLLREQESFGMARGGGDSNLWSCQTQGWVRLATKGLLKWGKKFSVINGLSVCPERAACTSRLCPAFPLGH